VVASSSDQMATVPATPKRKQLAVLTGIGVLLVLAGIIFGIYLLFFAGVNHGPSFIEKLRAGTIAESDIRSAEILKLDAGGGWPFSEDDYSRKTRQLIASPKTTGELISILRDSSTNGHQHRNHPSTLYYGILRIELIQGGHYYDGKYYAYINANSKGSTNPNGGAKYENVPLADFLKRNDPWYRDVDSPATGYRPGFPDDVP
jgi:hypothetical protein